MKTFWNECKKAWNIRVILVCAVLSAVLIGVYPGGLFSYYKGIEYQEADLKQLAEEYKQDELHNWSVSEYFTESLVQNFGAVLETEDIPKLEERRNSLIDAINRYIAENKEFFGRYGIEDYTSYCAFRENGALMYKYIEYKETYFKRGANGVDELVKEDEVTKAIETLEKRALFSDETSEPIAFISEYDKVLEALNNPIYGGRYDVNERFVTSASSVIRDVMPGAVVAVTVLFLAYFYHINRYGVTPLCYTAKTGRKLWRRQTAAAVGTGVFMTAAFCFLAFFLIENMGLQQFYDSRPDTVLIMYGYYGSTRFSGDITAAIRRASLLGMTIGQIRYYYILQFFLFGTGVVLTAAALLRKCRNLILGSIAVFGFTAVTFFFTSRYIYQMLDNNWLLFRYEGVTVGALLCVIGITALVFQYQQEKIKNF